jgi:hypothetical protein
MGAQGSAIAPSAGALKIVMAPGVCTGGSNLLQNWENMFEHLKITQNNLNLMNS